jgi:hypothetical protein
MPPATIRLIKNKSASLDKNFLEAAYRERPRTRLIEGGPRICSMPSLFQPLEGRSFDVDDVRL